MFLWEVSCGVGGFGVGAKFKPLDNAEIIGSVSVNDDKLVMYFSVVCLEICSIGKFLVESSPSLYCCSTCSSCVSVCRISLCVSWVCASRQGWEREKGLAELLVAGSIPPA